MAVSSGTRLVLLSGGATTTDAGSGIGAGGSGADLLEVARALASSEHWADVEGAALVVRPDPVPLLGALGDFDAASEARLATLRWQLEHALPRSRRLDYPQVERDCARLGAALVARFGRDELARMHFTALPRGGLIVLGLLAYELELEKWQLEPPATSDAPLVVVDDCALTGHRFGDHLSRCGSTRVIFAHLYSPPELRAAIEQAEARVLACVAAHDMEDHAPALLGAEHAAWQTRCLERLDAPRYWVGQPDPVAFPWSEAETGGWNPATERMERGWRLTPPRREMADRMPVTPPIPIQMQPAGVGEYIIPPHVLVAETDDAVILLDTRADRGSTSVLRDVAADMWRALLACESETSVREALLRRYDADESRLRPDLDGFVGTLVERELLERRA